MNTTKLDLYRALDNKLEMALNQMDLTWEQLSEEERNTLHREDEMAAPRPKKPILIDVPVKIGDTHAPRKLAHVKGNMKLFIWTDFCPDYFGGLAFAVAKDEQAAREMIVRANGGQPYDWGKLEVRSLSTSVARCVSGGG